MANYRRYRHSSYFAVFLKFNVFIIIIIIIADGVMRTKAKLAGYHTDAVSQLLLVPSRRLSITFSLALGFLRTMVKFIGFDYNLRIK